MAKKTATETSAPKKTTAKSPKCACGSQKTYARCCGPFIEKKKLPKTAEELMRSRYTAYTKSEIDYVIETTHPDKRDEIDRESITEWAKNSDWQKLEILKTESGELADKKGLVEFAAHYEMDGNEQRHHEIATFEKKDDQWFFYDGVAPKKEPVKRETRKIGRNEPCPCGSGKKYKKCCALKPADPA